MEFKNTFLAAQDKEKHKKTKWAKQIGIKQNYLRLLFYLIKQSSISRCTRVFSHENEPMGTNSEVKKFHMFKEITRNTLELVFQHQLHRKTYFSKTPRSMRLSFTSRSTKVDLFLSKVIQNIT
jgi:hypothetical protein